ncbi:MAG: hypothetical protein CO137_00215 [Candidatus Magasanikbacteria bacterium CG_4_9_14_3_um_filter_32_9]|uniref:HTH cro/C1-type domain-containing protein n=1 Tax=Candidatus Magasanikbacteria bacterium CG_4_9_14_3_um_filter_32_9 TaxID=1974644 RepID=A0A2M7Z7T9_9BACT|nr:MAG: hypothetical protein CO137_00215 [Candidatus Magasanikbacteria bacterium CG_4_9_14_3_um_filter_32_9]
MGEFSPREQRLMDLFKDATFVRGQDLLAEFRTGATGLVLTFEQVLDIFGQKTPKILDDIAFHGSALLPCHKEEPARTFRNRRNFLGFTIEEVAEKADVSIEDVLHAEHSSTRTSIRVLVKIAEVLDLDQRFISIKEGKEELGYLYEV